MVSSGKLQRRLSSGRLQRRGPVSVTPVCGTRSPTYATAPSVCVCVCVCVCVRGREDTERGRRAHGLFVGWRGAVIETWQRCLRQTGLRCLRQTWLSALRVVESECAAECAALCAPVQLAPPCRPRRLGHAPPTPPGGRCRPCHSGVCPRLCVHTSPTPWRPLNTPPPSTSGARVLL